MTASETSVATSSSVGFSSACASSAPSPGSSQSASDASSRITGIRSWIGRTTSLGSVVTIVQEWSSEPSFRTERAHSPANANSEWSGRVIHSGCFPVSVARHSKKPSAAIRHRNPSNASRNAGASATVSARALISIRSHSSGSA